MLLIQVDGVWLHYLCSLLLAHYFCILFTLVSQKRYPFSCMNCEERKCFGSRDLVWIYVCCNRFWSTTLLGHNVRGMFKCSHCWQEKTIISICDLCRIKYYVRHLSDNLLQVLDNLPHDLIYSKDQVSPWMEVWVEKRHEK